MKREEMSWLWRDPLRKLLHHIVRQETRTLHVSLVSYETRCGYYVTVDDVNPKTKVQGSPTCLRCAVAVHRPDVINDQE